MKEFKSVKSALLQFPVLLSVRGSCWLIYAAALMVLLAGLWAAKQSGQNADIQMRRDLVLQATDIAATVDPCAIRALSFTADDRFRPEFQLLCAQMRACAESAGINSLYTMALREGRIVFGPESLAEGHPYASPPGTVYQKPSPQDFDLFKTGRPQIHGPFSDEYGTFVTASAPVFDTRTGEVLAAICIDTEASCWRAAVRRAQWIPAGITFILLFVLLLNWLALKYRYHYSPQRNEQSRYAEPVLCVIFMALLTAVLAAGFDRAERETRRNTFRQMAQSHTSSCVEEIYELGHKIERLVCFFESSHDVTAAEFSSYCKKMVQDGVLQACLWLPAVPDAAAGSFVQAVQIAGRSDFSIWQKNNEGLNEPASSRPDYYPILYIEPLSGNKTAFGYDLNAEPVCRVAIQEALCTGLAVATDPVNFITQTNQMKGFYIFQRVDTPDQKGLAAFSVCPEKLLGGAQYPNRKNTGFEICLLQLQCGADPLVLAGSSSRCSLPCLRSAGSSLGITTPVFRFGKAYALRLIPRQSWLAAHPLRHGWIVTFFGMLISLLTGLMVALITNRRINLEKQIALRAAELKSSEAKYWLLAENIQDVITVFSPGGKALYASPSMKTVLGYDPAEFRGIDMYALVHPEDRDGLEKAMLFLMESGLVMNEARFRTFSGQYVWLATSVKLLRNNSGEPQELVCSSRDITERKRTEERIHLLARHLETIREDERKRLARELHDDIGQILTALKIDLLMIMDHCTCEHDTKQKMADMQKLLREGIQSVHSLCRRLRPGALDDLGLEEALAGLIDDWKQRNKVECELFTDVNNEALSDAVNTAVFRLIQEALTNVSRYACASKVGINLVSNEQMLNVSIADNGCGMEDGAANKPTSFGLLGMRERVETLGGTLCIESTPGKGTQIEAMIPLVRGGGHP